MSGASRTCVRPPRLPELQLSATASNTPTGDDIRQLRKAIAGVLGTTDTETLPTPDPEWRQRWTALAELGLTALCVPEDQGGLGNQVEVAAASASELGAGLCGASYAGVVAASHALATAVADGDERAAGVLTALIAGESIAAYGRLGTDGVARTVDGAPDAGALVLADAATGDLLLLDDPSTWTLADSLHPFDVTRSCADVTVDASSAHRIHADPVAADLFGLLLAADAVGGAERALDRTVAYAKDRQAFGKAIGGFQAVQHRLADHAVRLRGMSLLVGVAAKALAGDDPDAHRAVLLAEASVSEGTTHVLHDLLQLTGAIGFTWEYGLHFYERRAHHDARLAANPRRARHDLAELEGWTR